MRSHERAHGRAEAVFVLQTSVTNRSEDVMRKVHIAAVIALGLIATVVPVALEMHATQVSSVAQLPPPPVPTPTPYPTPYPIPTPTPVPTPTPSPIPTPMPQPITLR